MAATIIMTAVPAHFERSSRGYTMRVTEFLGRQLGRESRIIGTIAEIRAAVRAFGKRIREAHPEESFEILVAIGGRERQPRGFNAAQKHNGFGQDDFMAVREECLA